MTYFVDTFDPAHKSAGVIFQGHFGGYGDGAIQVAVESLAKRLGWNTGMVMQS